MFKILHRKYVNLTTDKRFSEILRGSVWALSAKILGTCFGLVFSIIVARFYGAEVVGILAVINSFLMLATIFTVLGTNTSILRLIPEHLTKYSPSSARKVYRKIVILVIGTSTIIGAILFVNANLIADKVFSKPQFTYYFALAAMFVVFKSLMLLNTQAVRGLKRIRMYAFVLILPQFSTLVILILLSLFFSKSDFPIYAQLTAYALTGIIGWICIEYNFKTRMRRDDQIHPMTYMTILNISSPMLMASAMGVVLSQSGIIMTGMFLSETEVGYYAIGVKLSILAAFTLDAISSIAAPKFSELYHAGAIEELFHVAKKSTKLMFFTTTPILICLIFLGKPILHIIFGQEYIVAYPALFFLTIGQFVNSISGSTGYFMNMTGNQHILKYIMLIATITNVCLNLLLIPRWGIIGSAIAAMLSISLWNSLILLYIRKKFGTTFAYFPVFHRNV